MGPAGGIVRQPIEPVHKTQHIGHEDVGDGEGPGIAVTVHKLAEDCAPKLRSIPAHKQSMAASARGAMDCFSSLAMTNESFRMRPIGTTGKSPKTCPALRAEIFCFRSHANQSHNCARLTADEGRSRSSRTCGEMRWTQELRLTCVAQAYGEVVWFGRRGAGVKRAIRSAATEAKEPFSGKSTK